ncbi:hypothetical protein [Actinoalloteichus hymeniacidonis]|uniref:Uncharacterized protein n=1 Tax=Actinoalloteichus hymeniacidonis TaxID=340345 RepID=A0AAC9HKS8_9PSEU|nr:hypothetical protein [Actinoalloteichus hymeniacidonis]AOS61045.1 hypothetical protein TL08_01005 [Actinoalloteichus hymeniacidonis]MBB5910955.1 hypothetical protein [Actinoalloteichus hymeniacidonis]
MNDPGTTGLLIAAGLTVVALLLLLYTGWARRGRSAAAREWMGNDFGSRTQDERMTVLGAPLLAVMCLCIALGILPTVGRYLMLVTFPIAALLFLPFLVVVLLPFVPLPNFVYPRWARPLRERNRQSETAIRAALRRRR